MRDERTTWARTQGTTLPAGRDADQNVLGSALDSVVDSGRGSALGAGPGDREDGAFDGVDRVAGPALDVEIGGGDGLEGVARDLEALCRSCVVCDDIQGHMERYYYTFLHLWKSDTAFREKWQASRGVCLPHAADLPE